MPTDLEQALALLRSAARQRQPILVRTAGDHGQVYVSGCPVEVTLQAIEELEARELIRLSPDGQQSRHSSVRSWRVGMARGSEPR